jgi:HEAT repeat protein
MNCAARYNASRFGLVNPLFLASRTAMMADVTSLANSLAHGTPEERLAAAEGLARLGTEASVAAIAIVQALEIKDDGLRDWLVAALEDLGAPAAADASALAGLVNSPSLDVAYWAATLLGRLESQAAPAVPQLTEALNKHAESTVRERAAWALGKIGPAAGGARSSLELAAKGGNARLARLAGEALSQIGG